MSVDPEGLDDALSGIGNHEVYKFGRQGLPSVIPAGWQSV